MYSSPLLLAQKTLIPLVVLLGFIASPSAQSEHGKSVSEVQFNQVSLSHDEVKKLGLEVTRATPINALPAKPFPAQVGYAPQSLTSYSMPFTGYVVWARNAPLKLGASVKAGQTLFEMKPLLTPEVRLNLLTSFADTEGQLKSAQEQRDANLLALNRATQLFLQHVGSQKAVDESKANLAIAEASVNAISQKQQLLKKAIADGASGTYQIRAASRGVINQIHFTSGQLVVAGAKLIDIVDPSNILITAYIPYEQMSGLHLDDAWISRLSTQIPEIQLTKVYMAQEADLLTGVLKVVYTSSKPGILSAMQKLTVTISQRRPQHTAFSIPCSSVVLDMYGSEWVYLREDATHFRRKHVFTSNRVGNVCVLEDHHLRGEEVVTQGSQELFAIETGYTH